MEIKELGTIERRSFLALAAAGVVKASEPVLRPAVSENACPLARAAPVARDGHRGLAFVRQPPGAGPFPAAVIIHGGLATWPEERLKEHALNSPTPSRFLAAGYIAATITYRSRDEDPQSKVSLEDCLDAINYVRRLSSVDPKSIVVYGCSGGGDLALEIAAATNICAIVPEEPASMLLAGIFNKNLPKRGARYSAGDGAPIIANPRGSYTPEFQKIMRGKLARIQCPILIIQGNPSSGLNQFNAEVLIPELRAAGKRFEVLTYPTEPHCFCFHGGGRNDAPSFVKQLTPHPEVALKAFEDLELFCRRHVPTKPKSMDSSVVKFVPVSFADAAF